jgi:hypothetical protein
MSDNLRSKLIRLAHHHPELRADLLPLVKKARETSDWVHTDIVDLYKEAKVTIPKITGGRADMASLNISSTPESLKGKLFGYQLDWVAQDSEGSDVSWYGRVLLRVDASQVLRPAFTVIFTLEGGPR